MAEFCEVIKHKKRICNIECAICPLALGNNGKRIPCDALEMQYPEEYEEIIMKWAEEHPVMINKQKMMEIIAEAFGEDLAIHLIGHRHKCEGIACGDNSCESCTYSKFWDKEYQPPNGEQ